MPSIIQTDTLKDGSGSKTLAEYSSSAWSWGAGVPANSIIGFEFMSTNAYANKTSSSYTSTGLTDTIQIKKAGSKIFIMVNVGGAEAVAGANSGLRFRLEESVTSLQQGLTDSFGAYVEVGGEYSASYVHTHGQSAGTTLTYTLTYGQNNNVQSVRINNYMSSGGTTSNMILMEVA